MTELIACLSEETGAREHLRRLINQQDWEKVIVISTKSSKEGFNVNKNVEFIIIDNKKFLPELVKEIKDNLSQKIKGIEVGLNIISGSGKEHMALLSALLKLGLAIRLVALTKEGVKEV